MPDSAPSLEALAATLTTAKREHEEAVQRELETRERFVNADVAFRERLDELTAQDRAAFLQLWPVNVPNQPAQDVRPDLPCCRWARRQACVCIAHWTCKRHGERHYGSHD